MSVVIEGYDKPKNCLSCPFNQYEMAEGYKRMEEEMLNFFLGSR